MKPEEILKNKRLAIPLEYLDGAINMDTLAGGSDYKKIIQSMLEFGQQCFEAGIKEGMKHEKDNRLNMPTFNYNYIIFENYLKSLE